MLISLLSLIVEVIICVGVWVMVAKQVNQRRESLIIKKVVGIPNPIISAVPVTEEESDFISGSLLEAHLMEEDPESVEEREFKAEKSREGRVF